MSEFSFLRMMDESDLPIVHAIEKQSYDFPWSLKGFSNSLDQGLNYVFCNSDADILGYCCVLTVLDEAHILNLCVSPQFHRKGIARSALNALLESLVSSDYRKVFLEVRASNLAAQNLYRSFGFSEDGVRKDYYPSQLWDESLHKFVASKESAILMSHSLLSE